MLKTCGHDIDPRTQHEARWDTRLASGRRELLPSLRIGQTSPEFDRNQPDVAADRLALDERLAATKRLVRADNPRRTARLIRRGR